MAKSRVKTPLKTFGGKYYLAPKLVPLMPPHTTYVEPFAGGLSVLLAKDPEGVNEIVSDLDGNLTTFWNILRSETLFKRFQRRCLTTPFSDHSWAMARALLSCPLVVDGEMHDWIDGMSPDDRNVIIAWAFFVSCRQSLSGRGGSFAAITKTRLRGGMNEQCSAWMSCVDGLAEVHARLRRVMILHRDAFEMIEEFDGPETLFYTDPPYLPETRTAKDVYTFEMSVEDHKRLLARLVECKGKVMLSGYDSDLYNVALAGWSKIEFDLPNNAASGKTKRRMVEVVWANFPLQAAPEKVAVANANATV